MMIKKNLLRRVVLLAFFSLCAVSLFSQDAKKSEAKKKYGSWTEIVGDMEVHLNNAFELYKEGKQREAYNEVNTAYFRFYESKGMEKTTMAYLSGARKNAVEGAFYEYRRNALCGCKGAGWRQEWNR